MPQDNCKCKAMYKKISDGRYIESTDNFIDKYQYRNFEGTNLI